MMIGSEHAGTSILGVFVQSVHLRLPDCAGTIPHQNVVQHQPGQRMIRVAPGRDRGGDSEGEACLGQDPPCPLISSSAQVQVGSQDDRRVGDRTYQVPCLKLATGSPEPAVPRRTPWVEMSTHYPEGPAAEGESGGEGHPSLQ